MNVLKISLTLALVAPMAAFAADKTAKPASTAASHDEAPEISLDDLKKAVADKSATIVDANSKEMYEEGHVPGAISYTEHKKDFAAVLPKDKHAMVVAYCGGTMCTAWKAAAADAKKLGYTNIRHFKSGIKGWKDAGEKTEGAMKKTDEKKPG